MEGVGLKTKIAFFDAKDYDVASFNKANAGDEFDIRFLETRLNAQTVDLAAGCDAVCVFVNDTVDREVIERLVKHGVKVLALRCAGYNHIDMEYAAGRIRVVRVPAYSPYAVAEHAMALLLTSVRRTHKAYIRTRDFNFSLNGMTGFDLHGKNVGVVGTGRIGRAFIDICKGFGMQVYAYDTYPAETEGVTYVSLRELWRRCDVISFHCPLTKETYHIVNDDSIAEMKKGVILINTSRGALFDSEALLKGIKERHIGAACLDVYEEESELFFHDFSGHILNDDTLARLISMPNVIVTSHQGFLTREALANIAETTLGNIQSCLEDGHCENEIGR